MKPENLTDEELNQLALKVMETGEDATLVLQELINRRLPIPGIKAF